MKFGLQAIHSWSTGPGVENVSKFLLDLAVEAEEAGWEGLFLWDHVMFTWMVTPIPDSWTILAAAAGMTEEITLGTNVTPLPRRRPQILARQLVTIDQISGGRVVLGAGLGGEGKGPDAGEEFTAFGEESKYTVLAEMCDESLDIITGLWSGEHLTYRGKHYTVEDVTFQPTPVQRPRIPIWIGGNSHGALKRAAKYDGWVTGGPSPSAGDPGLTLDEVGDRVKYIQSNRVADAPLDVAYAFEFPEERRRMEELTNKAEEAGVTWMLDGIFGLRFNGEKALEHVRRGPPQV
jgi:alkanesulfonate monooxygenase SsuD/methylene tetrahydromethanopterin reductase-like flavin-dependent oxidoreductase (luciferase family)